MGGGPETPAASGSNTANNMPAENTAQTPNTNTAGSAPVPQTGQAGKKKGKLTYDGMNNVLLDQSIMLQQAFSGPENKDRLAEFQRLMLKLMQYCVRGKQGEEGVPSCVAIRKEMVEGAQAITDKHDQLAKEAQEAAEKAEEEAREEAKRNEPYKYQGQMIKAIEKVRKEFSQRTDKRGKLYRTVIPVYDSALEKLSFPVNEETALKIQSDVKKEVKALKKMHLPDYGPLRPPTGSDANAVFTVPMGANASGHGIMNPAMAETIKATREAHKAGMSKTNGALAPAKRPALELVVEAPPPPPLKRTKKDFDKIPIPIEDSTWELGFYQAVKWVGNELPKGAQEAFAPVLDHVKKELDFSVDKHGRVCWGPEKKLTKVMTRFDTMGFLDRETRTKLVPPKPDPPKAPTPPPTRPTNADKGLDGDDEMDEDEFVDPRINMDSDDDDTADVGATHGAVAGPSQNGYSNGYDGMDDYEDDDDMENVEGVGEDDSYNDEYTNTFSAHGQVPQAGPSSSMYQVQPGPTPGQVPQAGPSTSIYRPHPGPAAVYHHTGYTSSMRPAPLGPPATYQQANGFGASAHPLPSPSTAAAANGLMNIHYSAPSGQSDQPTYSPHPSYHPRQ